MINGIGGSVHHQHIYTPLKNIKCNFRHQVFFIECGIHFGDFKTTYFSVLHEFTDKVFGLSFPQAIDNRGASSS